MNGLDMVSCPLDLLIQFFESQAVEKLLEVISVKI